MYCDKFLGAKERENLEFSDICRIYLGRSGDWTAFVFSLSAIFGALIVYYVLMSNFLYNTGHFIHGKFQKYFYKTLTS